ncbi:shikimate kinase [Aestuariirhabdus sp. Z084]|uniref:shikimate kinase n=1 Tax=Aestuariirhabdus haliotis TaxID=2918751 RepID=UPI00201B3883|nr:shikimate kinase [Aestuariirhabdus haliotis]MCL6417359.1 shikimate kinase [Aestuariirhabdus haliotis]MCL6421304.1 shikimate kinase [Aestuariirhabdus haliotis]
MNPQRSVILVGMPGAGKSTIGVQLAKELALDFVDTDLLIQLREGRALQDIMDDAGYLQLRHIEEQTLLEAFLPRHVIATGGSAVYGQEGMRHLRGFGPVVFLDASLAELKRRIHNYESRGIARRPEQSFEDLFAERRALYQQVADITIECDNKNQQQILDELCVALAAV